MKACPINFIILQPNTQVPDVNYTANEVYFDYNANNISFKPLHIETEDKSKALVDIMSEENKTKLNVTDNKEEKQKIRRQ